MSEGNLKGISKIIGSSYACQAEQARRTYEKLVSVLIEQKKLPQEGWSEQMVERFLTELSAMDSNNFPGNVGLGEREGRCACELVSRRHYRMSHGIGRSGDISAIQPKSAGSSLLAQLSTSLCLDLLTQLGLRRTQSCLLLPVATGMGLVVCMLSIRQMRPRAQCVIWSRIDQKSCFKAIVSAGYDPVVIELVRRGDELSTDLEGIRLAIQRLGSENVACVITTTSCFAPRVPDNVPEVAKICKEHDIPHLCNNAYGLQSTKCIHLVEEAMRVGRLDGFVQSTDKNILVPVGGCIVASKGKEFIEAVSHTYPGRASSTPSFDVFVTLLHLGVKGYKQLLSERVDNFKYLVDNLKEIAEIYSGKVLDTPHNQISIGLTLDVFKKCDSSQLTGLGAMLFTRFVSGTRVIPADSSSKTIGTYSFKNFGAHCNDNPCGYLTCAAGLGIRRDEIDIFITRLKAVLTKFTKSQSSLLDNGAIEDKLGVEPVSVVSEKEDTSDSKERVEL